MSCCPRARARAAGSPDGVAGSHVSLRDTPLSRDLAEFEVVAAPDGEHRRRVAVVGRRPFHLGNDVYLPVRQLAVYGMPLGLMASGALIERIGYPLTISVCCGIGLVFTLFIGMKWRSSMWQTRVTPRTPSIPQRV